MLLVLASATAAQATSLATKPPVAGSLNTYNLSGVYVAGVSASGYMATQLQVAYSGRIKGAAIFAAGPYYCAQNNASQALYGCMDNLWPTYLANVQSYTKAWASYGWIDPVGNLSGKRDRNHHEHGPPSGRLSQRKAPVGRSRPTTAPAAEGRPPSRHSHRDGRWRSVNQAFRHRKRASSGDVLHCISTPVEVCPNHPCSEQNAPGVTPSLTGGSLVAGGGGGGTGTFVVAFVVGALAGWVAAVVGNGWAGACVVGSAAGVVGGAAGVVGVVAALVEGAGTELGLR